MKTLVLEEMPQLFWNSLNEKEENNIITEINDYSQVDVVIMRTKIQFDLDMINNFPNLKLIIRAGSGYDNIDCLEAKKKGIKVCNTPNANSFSAYEQTISFIMALIKRHQLSKIEIKKGNWKKNIGYNIEISDLKVLVVGVGRIGSMVAQTLKLLGAQVKGVDPYAEEAHIPLVSYEEGLIWCNMITYHCQLYSETKNYFDKKSLSNCSEPIWLINVARGGCVDMQAVKNGLEKNKILGAAFDVFKNEPLHWEDFFANDRIYISPHLGGATQKAKNRMALETLKVLRNFRTNPEKVKEIDYRFV